MGPDMPAVWYFDVISPYAYLHLQMLKRRQLLGELQPRPILFAALLNHWENVGPAEIPPKRLFTYQYVKWFARRHEIPIRMPGAHPFNPLPLLRLTILRSEWDWVTRAFDFVWREGRLPDDDQAMGELLSRAGVSPRALISEEAKLGLRESTQEALARGVFGVPTIAVDEQNFWGMDATDMYLDYVRDPKPFDPAELETLPSAADRRR